MSDLVAFLRACVDEDELWARAAIPDEPGDHTEYPNPDRLLREVEAKRAIIQWCIPDASMETALENGDISTEDYVTHKVVGTYVLHLLASVYRDHPDYDGAWKP